VGDTPKLGFGHLGEYEAQLVLQSVAEDATLQSPFISN